MKIYYAKFFGIHIDGHCIVKATTKSEARDMVRSYLQHRDMSICNIELKLVTNKQGIACFYDGRLNI